jgi:hypothetical protein
VIVYSPGTANETIRSLLFRRVVSTHAPGTGVPSVPWVIVWVVLVRLLNATASPRVTATGSPNSWWMSRMVVLGDA